MAARILQYCLLFLTALVVAFPVMANTEKSPIKVQFTFSKTRSILIPARVNGRSVVLLLDTGADETYIDTIAVDAHFESDGDINIFTPTGRTVQHVYVASVVFGPLNLHMRVIGIDLTQMRKGCGCKAAGILGMSVLRQFSSMEVDFRNSELLLKD